MSGVTDKKSKCKQTAKIDDDEFLEQCIKSNQICSHSSCEKSIKLIRLQCQFCNDYFCTSHHLPEIHGCGNAARKSASAPPKKAPNPEKVQMLEKKMSQKLDKMKNDRKKKGK